MIFLLSPAKSLDYSPLSQSLPVTEIRFQEFTQKLVNHLRDFNPEQLQKLMSISADLAKLNVDRFIKYDYSANDELGKAAAWAFNGGVYQGLDVGSIHPEHIDYFQKHVRILSGLYGLLRPTDLIQPYRLEMGTKLKINDHKNLYEFWGDSITHLLSDDMSSNGTDVVINCASKEYFKAIQSKKIQGTVIDIHFRELRGDQLKFISFNAKKARGLLTRFAVDNELQHPEDLKGFDYDGYMFDASISNEKEWYFTK